MRAVFVLHPEMARVKPRAVARGRARADDHGDLVRIAALAFADLERPPAFPAEILPRRGDVEPKRIASFVRDDQVVVTILVDVGEAQTAVVARLVHNGNAL